MSALSRLVEIFRGQGYTGLEDDAVEAEDSAVIKVKTLVLTNAQIKKLPNTLVDIVASPGSNKVLIPLFAVVVANCINGAYTFSGDGVISIVASEGGACFGALQEDIAEAYPLIASGSALKVMATIHSQFLSGGDGSELDNFEDQGLSVKLTGVDADADLTDGHADNTLEVSIYYIIKDIG